MDFKQIWNKLLKGQKYSTILIYICVLSNNILGKTYHPLVMVLETFGP